MRKEDCQGVTEMVSMRGKEMIITTVKMILEGSELLFISPRWIFEGMKGKAKKISKGRRKENHFMRS